jgi:hypothetical protein
MSTRGAAKIGQRDAEAEARRRRESAPEIEEAQDEAPTKLTGRDLLWARLAWIGLTLFTVGIFIASFPARAAQLQSLDIGARSPADIMRAVDLDSVRNALEELNLTTEFYTTYNLTVELIYAVVFFAVALVIFKRRSDEPMALYMSLTLILFGTASIPTFGALGEANPTWELPLNLLTIWGWILVFILLYIFPDGRFVPGWTRYLVALFTVWHLAFTFFPEAPFSPWQWPAWVPIMIWVPIFLMAVACQIYRHYRLSTHMQREQTKWVLYGMAVAVVGGALVSLPNIYHRSMNLPGHPAGIYEIARLPLQYLFILAFPISIGIAIIRRNLYGIDFIINRTLVYIPLTGILTGLYSAVIALLQRIFMAVTGERSDAAVVMTTLILASTFTPIKNALQGAVDRRFKEVPDSTKALRAFQLELDKEFYVLDARKVTRRLLDEVAKAYGAKSGAVYLVRQGEMRLTHVHGEWTEGDATLKVPIRRSDGTVVGRISLGHRTNGEEYTGKEREALEEISTVVADEMNS